jgi:hypothetical protein
MSLHVIVNYKIIQETLHESVKIFLNLFGTVLWNVGGPFFIPKGITLQINTPQSVTNDVLYLSFKIMEI